MLLVVQLGHVRSNELEEKVILANQWISLFGLKVNAFKTELVIFNKHDCARESIYFCQIRIESKAEMKVVDKVFNHRLEWLGQEKISIQS